ncbi:DUF3572 domain-containing protein [Pseudoroseicyclus tamaricis]|uniref:DUF3572 domain-containing protein n=1 Tax=Pseudoroseicyclus tamaricis TaxID=2705421 RepID=UPI001F183943|nr:DUF3572 domain-containing protein [Pseudoroseicyclus tamaricis]
MTPQNAEIVGIEALAWLVGDEELLPVFLGASGADLAWLREGAGDPAVLASVLDFLLLDDAWVGRFAAETGHAPEALMQARVALPGAEQVHWT